MVVTTENTLNKTLLQAFDDLFDRAMNKLNLACSDEERKQARESFRHRFGVAIELIQDAGAGSVSPDLMREMESAIDELSPAHMAGYLAVGPLAVHLHRVMRSIAAKAAEQKLLEQMISQVDDRYGGN